MLLPVPLALDLLVDHAHRATRHEEQPTRDRISELDRHILLERRNQQTHKMACSPLVPYGVE
jgi:hypothetical protein